MGPPDDDGRQSNGGSKNACQPVIARGGTTEIFEPAEHTLDKIALFVDFQIDRPGMLAGRMAGNDAGRATKASCWEGLALHARPSPDHLAPDEVEIVG
jgi:hypothetical protein